MSKKEKRFGYVELPDNTRLLNVRDIPSIDVDSKIIAVIMSGTKIKVLGEDNGFYKISCRKEDAVMTHYEYGEEPVLTIIGYVMSEFIRLEEVDDGKRSEIG